MKKNLEDSGKSKNRRKVKKHYWVVGKNIFFLEHKDKNFFCCLQTFFITGLTFFTHLFYPDPENKLLGCENLKKRKKIWNVLEIVKNRRKVKKHSWGNNPKMCAVKSLKCAQ